MHSNIVQIDCQFTVAATNANGISGLKGPAVSAVYMHTSATPSSGNPNPANGNIVVQLQDPYYSYLSMRNARVTALSGSDVKIDNSAMTAGVAYVIATLGDATAAKWQAIGVPVGVTAAVGVPFIAASNGGSGNALTSRVQAAASTGSAVAAIELIGNSATVIAPNPLSAQTYGAYFIFQCRDYAGALVAPVDGSVISLELLLSNSSVPMSSSGNV